MASKITKKIKRLWSVSILKSIYFNFHYLPFSQARYLPILFRKPKFEKLKGQVKIKLAPGQRLSPGMIMLGQNIVGFYPDSGIRFANHGGVIVFHGRCDIGNNSVVAVGEKGCLTFGENFNATSTLRLGCFHSVTFMPWVSFGFDCTVMDTDFHSLKSVNGDIHRKGYGPILIGRECWIGTDSLVLKNTTLPDHTTVSAKTKLSGNYDIPPYSVIGSRNNIEVLAEGFYRDRENHDDIITYPTNV